MKNSTIPKNFIIALVIISLASGFFWSSKLLGSQATKGDDLIYTGIARTSSDVAKTFVTKIAQKEKQLLVLNEMVEQALNILNSKQNINEFGKLLHESWRLKRSLSPSVSNSFIDDIYLKALSAGAIGGKIIGAGGGGFILLFIPSSHQTKVKKIFNKLIHVPFKFEHEGSQIIFFDQQEDYNFKKT